MRGTYMVGRASPDSRGGEGNMSASMSVDSVLDDNLYLENIEEYVKDEKRIVRSIPMTTDVITHFSMSVGHLQVAQSNTICSNECRQKVSHAQLITGSVTLSHV